MEASFSNDEKLKARIEKLKKEYCPNKAQVWLQSLRIIRGDASLDPKEAEDDYSRELKIYEIAYENTSKMIKKLIKSSVPIWRPSDYKAETFKPDDHMKKIQNSLEESKKRIEVVEKRKESKNKKKFGKEAHKRHVQAKRQRKQESHSKTKKMQKKRKPQKNSS